MLADGILTLKHSRACLNTLACMADTISEIFPLMSIRSCTTTTGTPGNF